MYEPDDTSIRTDGNEEEMLILNFENSSEDDFLTTNYSQEAWEDL